MNNNASPYRECEICGKNILQYQRLSLRIEEMVYLIQKLGISSVLGKNFIKVVDSCKKTMRRRSLGLKKAWPAWRQCDKFVRILARTRLFLSPPKNYARAFHERVFTIMHHQHATGFSLVLANFSFLPHILQQQESVQDQTLL
jgi:hypothetical protein